MMTLSVARHAHVAARTSFVPPPAVRALVAIGPTQAAVKSTGLTPASTTVALVTVTKSRVARDASAVWRRCSGVDALDATSCGHDAKEVQDEP